MCARALLTIDGSCFAAILLCFPSRADAATYYVSPTGLSLRVVGLTSHGNVIVHASTDLVTWTPIFTNPPVTGNWQYTDPAATNFEQRFYKVQEQ